MDASNVESKSGKDLRIGVYVCHCGLNIAGSVNCEKVAEYASTLPNVVLSKHNLYTCSDPGQETIKKDIINHNLNRVVVASCTPRLHEPTFRRTCEEAGLNKYLLQKAGIYTPKIFKSPSEIDRLVIAKVPEKQRAIERAFFYASSPEEFEKTATERIKQGIITEEALKGSIIEEYVIGAKFNANLFWSPLTGEIDLLGFDRRIQTDLDGVLDLPATEQLELKIPTQNIEIGHMGSTMRESQIEKIFTAAEHFVDTCKTEYPPGMIGLFALQGAVTKDLKYYVFDVSPRVPGCPCVEPTSPYMKYKYGVEVGPGRRVAMEIKRAVKEDRLGEVVT